MGEKQCGQHGNTEVTGVFLLMLWRKLGRNLTSKVMHKLKKKGVEGGEGV